MFGPNSDDLQPKPMASNLYNSFLFLVVRPGAPSFLLARRLAAGGRLAHFQTKGSQDPRVVLQAVEDARRRTVSVPNHLALDPQLGNVLAWDGGNTASNELISVFVMCLAGRQHLRLLYLAAALREDGCFEVCAKVAGQDSDLLDEERPRGEKRWSPRSGENRLL